MAAPRLIDTTAELARALAGETVGFVPTMGALHEGHASLMRTARQHVGPGQVVVSIFVNPLQFGPGEDLARYPRTLEHDLTVCAASGVDVVFAPSVEQVYPGGDPHITIDPGPLGSLFEGRSRPGHFRGVLTVVAKLLGLVRPHLAVFGEKDYQQLVLIRRMVSDLCLGATIVGGETRRDPDGLAMSSRNRYLDPEERSRALALHRALRAAQESAAREAEAQDQPARALAAAQAVLAEQTGIEVDYLALTDEELGVLPARPTAPGRALVAARVGGTRLIDNLPLRWAGQG